MTFRDFTAELQRCGAHDLEEVNAEIVGRLPGRGLILSVDTSDIEAERDEARDNEKRLTEELKECERERDEWERIAKEGDDELKDLRMRKEDVQRVRELANDWAREVQAMRAELSALRKRKGVTVGILAHWGAVMSLLSYISQSKDNRYCSDARELHGRITSC